MSRDARTHFSFDLTDRASMGDPMFVEGQVREMLDDCRKLLLEAPEGSNPQIEIKNLAYTWSERFWAGNSEFVQTMTPQAQAVWLQGHGLGDEEIDPKAPVTCLVAVTLGRFVDAVVPFAEGRIHRDQVEFWLEAAIEDCTCMLLGIENAAD